MPHIAYETPQFREDFRRADRQAQGKIESFIRKFGEDAHRGGLQVKTPETAVDRRVKVARVDQRLRAVLVELDEGAYALVRVMDHDPAYDWAGSLRPDVSLFDGLPRLIQMPAAGVNVPVGDTSEAPALDVFAHRRDRDFEHAGVPGFVVPMLRGLHDVESAERAAEFLGDSDPLLGLAILGLLDADRTIEEIYAELLSYAGGDGADDETTPRSDGVWSGLEAEPTSKPQFDSLDLAAAVRRPGADERFRVVEDSDDLIAALQGDFAAWQIFLHPLQRAAAYREYSGPARISGGAGTGKTVVLLHRIKALLDRSEDPENLRILVTTYTSHLRRDLRDLLAQLLGRDVPPNVEIETVDALAKRLHADMSGEAFIDLTVEQELDLWREIAVDAGVERSPFFLRSEYRHVVLAHGVRTLERYLSVSRAGRGLRLTAAERSSLWPAFELYEARTRESGRASTLQLTEGVAALLEQLPTGHYDHVLVDEAQDLHASQWRLLRGLVEPGPNDLFLVGDAMQRIYGDTVSLRSVGIETRGRAIRLRRNYRTTHEIVEWALGVVGDETVVDLDELGTNLSGYHSVRHGPRPVVLAFGDRAGELQGIAHLVGDWLAAGHPAEQVAVACRTPADVAEVAGMLVSVGIAALELGRQGRLGGGVNVATMARLKGLEYRCVAVTGLSVDAVPAPGAVCPRSEDLSQHLTDLQSERSLVYVAATRARDELALCWGGRPSSLLPPDIERVATSAGAV